MLDLGSYSYDQLSAMEDLLSDLCSHPYITSPNGVDAGIIRMWLRGESNRVHRAICAKLDIMAGENDEFLKEIRDIMKQEDETK